MGKSPRSGSCSSQVEASIDVTQKLAALSETPTISALQSALGPDAALHLVGGAVRDAFSHTASSDIDLATALSATEIHTRLEARGVRVIPTGIQHGTITAVVDGENVEITTFRTPGTREKFIPGLDIFQDLAGRDFTINALAWNITAKQLIDPHGGARDLADGVLRAVGDPHERFREDPLRLLRCIRFGPAAGRSIHTDTALAAGMLVSSINTVSPERVREELCRILVTEHTRSALSQMLQLGLLAEILPEILPSIGFAQNEFHTEDVFEHTLTVVENADPNIIVRLAALFHDLGKPGSFSVGDDGRRHFYDHEVISTAIAKKVMERLRFSTEEIRAVTNIVALHMRPLNCGPAGIRRIIRDTGEQYELWRRLKMADVPPVIAKEEFERQLADFDAAVETERTRPIGSPFSMLALDGYDILALGCPPGKAVGSVLHALREMVLDNPEINQKDSLTQAALLLIDREKNRTDTTN